MVAYSELYLLYSLLYVLNIIFLLVQGIYYSFYFYFYFYFILLEMKINFLDIMKREKMKH